MRVSDGVIGCGEVSSIMYLPRRPDWRPARAVERWPFDCKCEVYLRSGAARQVLAELSGVDSDGGRLAEFCKSVEVSIREQALRINRVAPP